MLVAHRPPADIPAVSQYLRSLTSLAPEVKKPLQSSVQVAAAVAAHARIAMSRFMNIPGNPVLYSDTDSLFLQHPLSPEMVKKHVSRAGNELGKLKYEGKVKQLVVISTKVIGYLDGTGQERLVHSQGDSLSHSVMLQAVGSSTPTVFNNTTNSYKHGLPMGGVRVAASPHPTLVKPSIILPSKSPTNTIYNSLGDENPFTKYAADPTLLPPYLQAKRHTPGGKT